MSGLVKLKKKQEEEANREEGWLLWQGMGAYLKCLTLASIVALRCQAAPVATSSFRRKFYFTQIRVNLASEKLPKDQSTTRNWSRSRRQ